MGHCELSALSDTQGRWMYLITHARDVPAYQWHCHRALLFLPPPSLKGSTWVPCYVINDSTRRIIYYGSTWVLQPNRAKTRATYIAVPFFVPLEFNGCRRYFLWDGAQFLLHNISMYVQPIHQEPKLSFWLQEDWGSINFVMRGRSGEQKGCSAPGNFNSIHLQLSFIWVCGVD